MISLTPMDDSEAVEWLEESARSYAKEQAEASGIGPEGALTETRRFLTELLPYGVKTEAHSFRWIEHGVHRVGKLWVGPRPGVDRSVHIWDIEIESKFQGQGHGGAAIDLVADEARANGARSLTLNVFKANPGAKRLYERKGFSVIDSTLSQTFMSLKLE